MLLKVNYYVGSSTWINRIANALTDYLSNYVGK